MDDVYDALREHLDNLPAGFPSTESGVEIRILKRLFTPAEAELAVHLRPKLEPAAVIAERAGMSEEGWHSVSKPEKDHPPTWRPSLLCVSGNIM